MTEVASIEVLPLPVKLRIEDYLLLDDAGAFDDYAKTELLDGEIVFMNAQHRPHARLKMKIYDALREALRAAGLNLTPLVEVSISVPAHSVPEPDIVVTSEPDGEGLIPLASVALVVEVSDSTINSDLTRKAELYAGAGIVEYWVADIGSGLIHQMWQPTGTGYAECHRRDLHAPFQAVSLPIAINLSRS